MSFSRAEADRRHAAAYFGTVFSDDDAIHAWSEEMGVLHWPDSYPEIFSSHRSGFDAVIGNPPYEIVSVQESGIMERRREQSYFRTMYDTCSGKINTYRLMVERGLSLLRRGGVLGFIVPATLLADSTAARLRERVLEESQVLELVVVPESAQVFDGVTQAVVIVVTRAGGRTEGLRPAFWNGKDCTPLSRGAMVTPGLVKRIGMRIPLIRSEEEKALLQALNQYAPFGGDRDFRPVGSVHQGEINLSVHRRFITSRQTRHPLIRGEHIEPFRVRHPSNSSGRLDWVDEPFFVEHATKGRNSRPGSAHRTSSSHAKPETPWEHERIGLARVVNMATRRRLKAALVPAGYLLGDMTNFIANRTLTQGYLLGLLNSRLLNWRIRLTSTNNYISAAEIEALPVPRIVAPRSMERESRRTTDQVHELLDCASGSLPACLERVHELMRRFGAHGNTSATVEIMESLVEEIMSATGKQEHETEYGQAGQNLLDALVLRLYGVESFIQVLMD